MKYLVLVVMLVGCDVQQPTDYDDLDKDRKEVLDRTYEDGYEDGYDDGYDDGEEY